MRVKETDCEGPRRAPVAPSPRRLLPAFQLPLRGCTFFGESAWRSGFLLSLKSNDAPTPAMTASPVRSAQRNASVVRADCRRAASLRRSASLSSRSASRSRRSRFAASAASISLPLRLSILLLLAPSQPAMMPQCNRTPDRRLPPVSTAAAPRPRRDACQMAAEVPDSCRRKPIAAHRSEFALESQGNFCLRLQCLARAASGSRSASCARRTTA